MCGSSHAGEPVSDTSRELAEHVAHLAHAGRVERVVDLRALAPRADETRFAEHLEMLADGRLGDAEDLGEGARARAA
jgi:hypothetical protein